MKKSTRSLLIIMISSCFVANAYAARNVNACDYKDTFYITSGTAPATSHIIGSVAVTGDGQLTDVTATAFAIRGICSGQGNATAVVTIGTSAKDSCALTIKDGQFYMDPVVENINCKGNYSYSGITYDGVFSYRYKLHFSRR